MAKKVDASFTAEICKNTEKGGAWLATYTLTKDGEELGYVTQAWSNASAAKRWIKSKVVERTPRKSIKMEVTIKDVVTDKPLCLKGELNYKEEV
jgi:hypothetical protein